MMTQVAAAALTSENKVLCHPSSVDSIPTVANNEDHVSMGGMAVRKALKVIENVENVLCIELLCACQAIELNHPHKSTKIIEEVVATVHHYVPFLTRDTPLTAYL
jgi:histidine ammonia-lyase